MSVYLQPELNEWVEGRLADGNFATISDYFRTLIRADMERRGVGERRDGP
ncbi:MAG: hypothetical protein H6843_00960 [Rhodospirillaceae bacterium]|nr:hypothetical protein [Rhodospirillaceae bacterium]